MKWYLETEDLTEKQAVQVSLQLYEQTRKIGASLKDLLEADIENAKMRKDSPDKILYMEAFKALIEEGINKGNAGIDKYLQQLN